LALAGLKGFRAPALPVVLEPLRRHTARSAARALTQLNELTRLVRSFERAGIPVLTLKGVVLSEQLYGDPCIRSANDIDLLVDPAQFQGAANLLIAEGYSSCSGLYSKREFEVYRRHIKEMEYRHGTSGLRVELHHRLADNERLLPCSFHELLSERDEVAIGGLRFATLPRDILPVYLCVHGVSHGWQRLMWLTDFAASLRPPNGAQTALIQAEKFGLGPLMLHSLALSGVWFAAPVPEKFLPRAVATRQGRLLDRIVTALFISSLQSGVTPTWVDRCRKTWLMRWYTLAAKIDRRYWRIQLAREFVSPADWQKLRLPDRLFWLYWACRPFGWLVRLAMRRRHG
jgi:hypothetical protein